MIWMMIFLLAPMKLENSHFRSELRAYEEHERIHKIDDRLALARALLDRIDRELNQGLATADLDALIHLIRANNRVEELLIDVEFQRLTVNEFKAWKGIKLRQEAQYEKIKDFIDKFKSELRVEQSV